MSVTSFKFVSPGVFINEIDNSFIPKSADSIGPVVIGRAQRGLAMQPVTVESYSDFVTMFGDTVPGGGGGDVYRDGNLASPMYGTYAAKAFLNANVAPLTYIRLLGQENYTTNGTTGDAGWKTGKDANHDHFSNGGAYGMFIFHSGAAINCDTGSLAAVWYLDVGSIALSGTVRGGLKHTAINNFTTASTGVVIGSGTDDSLWTVVVSGSGIAEEKIKFNFDDTSENYIRKKFNTNPHLGNENASSFYPVASEKHYFLGETYDQFLRDQVDKNGSSLLTGSQAVILALQNSSGAGMHKIKQESREAVAGWFIGQDLGAASSYVPFNAQKLFRLKGRGHGEWLHKNCKVSIEKIRQSVSRTTDYGTFSLVIRDIKDSDNNVIVLERFDNLNLDPTSANFIARRIGDKYYKWDTTQKRLKQYGEYDNESKFVYVEMNADVEAGATDATLLPFGYYGAPKFTDITQLVSGTYFYGDVPAGQSLEAASNAYITGGAGIPSYGPGGTHSTVIAGATSWLSGGTIIDTYNAATLKGGGGNFTGSLLFPKPRLRLSASDGNLSDPTKAYFGFQTTRLSSSTMADAGVGDLGRLLFTDFPDDPVATGWRTTAGIDAWSEIFTLDNVVSGSDGNYYSSGSRAREDSHTTGSYTDLLEDGYDRFTAQFWGGWDGFDLYKPDPMYNAGMSATSTETSDYAYYTWKRAIDTVADPEFVNMNLLTAPGLTLDSLTTHAVNVCEERADAMALIDLPNVYLPSHEQYKSDKADRIATTPIQAAKALRDRQIDSSYGATFYPWVQSIDANSGARLWMPPSVAVLGVLASSQASTQIWFAPAGFNRGGLTDGAAGIPVIGVTERLTSKDRDDLYESNINPIASFPSSGIVLFGQKTLQERQSALDRINVRRLVIYLKKQISILATEVLFEQNVSATWNRFKSLVEPFLVNVKTEYGITDYRLILDDTTTTADLIDQNIMYAKIMIKPARAIEYIAIDFVIASTGASFDD